MGIRGTALVSTKLAALSRALSELVATMDAGGLDALDDRELVEFLQGFEAVRSRMSAVDPRASRGGVAEPGGDAGPGAVDPGADAGPADRGG